MAVNLEGKMSLRKGCDSRNIGVNVKECAQQQTSLFTICVVQGNTKPHITVANSVTQIRAFDDGGRRYDLSLGTMTRNY